MSYGAFRNPDRPDVYENRCGPKNATPIEIFETTDYLSGSKHILVNEFKIPEGAIEKINKIIGRFFRAIQEASFIENTVMPGFKKNDIEAEYDPMTGVAEDQREAHWDDRCSTLTPHALVATIRKNLPKAIRKLIGVLQNSAIDKTDQDEKESPSSSSSLSTMNISHESRDEEIDFSCFNFLTPEAREILRTFGPDSEEIMEEILAMMSKSILSRSSLSYPSTNEDIQFLRRHRDDSFQKKARYSTLHPEDFTKLMKDQFQWYIIATLRLFQKPNPTVLSTG